MLLQGKKHSISTSPYHRSTEEAAGKGALFSPAPLTCSCDEVGERHPEAALRLLHQLAKDAQVEEVAGQVREAAVAEGVADPLPPHGVRVAEVQVPGEGQVEHVVQHKDDDVDQQQGEGAVARQGGGGGA